MLLSSSFLDLFESWLALLALAICEIALSLNLTQLLLVSGFVRLSQGNEWRLLLFRKSAPLLAYFLHNEILRCVRIGFLQLWKGLHVVENVGANRFFKLLDFEL